jgi:hypothetical protein
MLILIQIINKVNRFNEMKKISLLLILILSTSSAVADIATNKNSTNSGNFSGNGHDVNINSNNKISNNYKKINKTYNNNKRITNIGQNININTSIPSQNLSSGEEACMVEHESLTKASGEIISQSEESSTFVNDKCNRAEQRYREARNNRKRDYNLAAEHFNNTCAKKYNFKELYLFELDVGLILTKTGSGCY